MSPGAFHAQAVVFGHLQIHMKSRTIPEHLRDVVLLRDAV